ncbi:MAG: DUF4148 domain-containing protein [Rubrivivax sp.]
MTTTRTLIALATFTFAAAGSAFAQEATSDAWMHASTTKTVAQVHAELVQARADGSIKAVSIGYIDKLVSSQPRADVAAAASQALRSGEIDRLNAEAYAFQRPAGEAAVGLRVAQAKN